MKDHPAIAVTAGLVLLGSLTAITLTFFESPWQRRSPVQDEIGRTLAREAVKHLAPGRRLTVLTRDTATFPQPAADQVLSSFTRETARAGAPVAAIQRFEVDPLRPTQVPPGDFLELMRRSSSGDVIVSLLGPPLLNDEQRALLPAVPGYRIVALCVGPFPDAAGLRQLAAQNVLHVAIVDRPRKVSAGTATSRGQAEGFDTLYTVFQPTAAVNGSRSSP